MIRELTVQDSGTYQCGIDLPSVKDIYTPVELKVKKGSSVSREVIAYAGTRSNIKCSYDHEYKKKPKAFCKMGTHQWCFNPIKTKLHSEWSHDGRFSIHDNRSAGFFSVFIRELITGDTGTYACAVVVSNETEFYTVLTLNVTQDLSNEKSISKTVHVGGDLTVSCKYPESHRNDNKFLCKRSARAACSYSATVKESRKYINNGKFSLYDDRETQMFTVSIRNVTEQDSGEYWCGAEAAWTSDHGYKVYFTQINLTVTGFPVITVVIVSVILLALLGGISFLIVTLRKRCKLQGQERITEISRATNGDEHEPDFVYESGNANIYQLDPIYENLDY
ncbi:polymeric immunoglobulin receptor [Ictalurus punctatus]|uniref:polymeric immunoglobulin receptor n=1 Tax=Ictalurus punctatus TaxID=7998 RepID=UPI0023551953|nr:polymeric immunoglobulin receptor [Ictalurus punctatus]